MTKIYTLLAISVGVVLLIISMFTPMREALIIIATVGLLAVYYKSGFVAFFILLAAYFPMYSLVYAWLSGVSYVNHMNHGLQEDAALMLQTIIYYFISISTAIVIIFSNFKIKPMRRRFLIADGYYGYSNISMAIFTSMFLFFFWLTDPGETFLTASYSVLLTQRFENTQFSGTLGLMIWISCFVSYKTTLFKSRKIFVLRYFNMATVISILWLALHAKRVELIAILLSYLLYDLKEKKEKKVIIYSIVMFFILTGIGGIREIFVKDVIITNELNQYVASLPGGASNVFMSLSLVIDFYKENGLLYGETFYNYFFQLLPSFVYSIIPYAPPKPFDSIGIFSMYDWNGGINFMSIFYANFGILGSILSGIFVGVYVLIVYNLLRQKEFIYKIISIYMFGMSLGFFWYELITVIKPVSLIILFYVGYLLLPRKNV